MKKYGIIGYGALGRQVHNLIKEAEKQDRTIRFFDDNAFQQGIPFAYPFQHYLQPEFEDFSFYLGLGYHQLQAKSNLLGTAAQNNLDFPSLIHYTSYISPFAHIREGVIIYPKCNIDQNVVIESGTLLNNSVTVSHDSIIGRCSFLAPGVCISGNVKIGSCSFIGAGTTIANNITIGDNVVIGAGSVVTQDVPSNQSAIGNPLKLLTKPLKLI